MLNPTWLYVGAIYGLAIWLRRRISTDFPWRIGTLFYVLVLLFLFEPLTGDVVNLPIDFLQALPPWALLTRDHHVMNPETNDLTLQIVPWAHQVREAWLSGRIPLWNHLSGAGYPLLANAQSCALSPLRLLALPLPVGRSFTAEAAIKLLIALTFTFMYCRRHYSEIASAAGAICFAFCSFLIIWLHFPLATVAVFLPSVLYQIDLIVERCTYARLVFAAVLWAIIIFGGHPETVAHIFFIALLYGLWIVGVERRAIFRLLIILGAVLLVAGLLAAPFLAPFAEALTKSRRYHELKATPNAIGYYSDWPSVVLLIQPRFFGQLPFEKPWVSSPSAESITGFAGILGIAAWFALGIHVIRARAWRSRETFFVTATVLVLGIILGWPGVSDVFHALFRLAANARLRLVLCFLLAVLTAAAIDLLRRDRHACLIGIMICAGLLLAVTHSVSFPTAAARDTAVLVLLPSVVVLTIAAVATASRGHSIAVMVLIVAIVADVWYASSDWNPNIRATGMYARTPLIKKLQALKASQPPTLPFRIVGIGPVLFPNVSAMFGIEDIRAHDPMANGRYLGVLRVLTGYDTEDYFAKWSNVETSMLDYLNVKYVVTLPRADLHDSQRYALVYDGSDGRIFENTTVLPRFYPVRNVILEFKNDRYVRLLQEHRDWANTALVKNLPVENDRMRLDMLAPRPKSSPDVLLRLTSASVDKFRMRVNAPRYSLIASSIPWWPGWKVQRNGKLISPIRINGAFLGFPVPPGQADVIVWYSPLTFWIGLAVSILTTCFLTIISMLAHFQSSARRQ